MTAHTDFDRQGIEAMFYLAKLLDLVITTEHALQRWQALPQQVQIEVLQLRMKEDSRIALGRYL